MTTTKRTKPSTAEGNTEANNAMAAEVPRKATGAARGGNARETGKVSAKTSKPRRKPAVADGAAKAERKPRTDTKQANLIAMLQAKDGASVEEIASAFAWQPHTARGALYGVLKKKLGLDIISEKVESRGRVYRIAD